MGVMHMDNAGLTDSTVSGVTDRDLLQAARSARLNAWCPYSGYQVGCALLDAQGKIHSGANVENASYGLTICAERSAFFAAVSKGVRKIAKVIVVTGSETPAPPCGACRQVLAEFGLDFQIGLAGISGDGIEWHTMADLLPNPFIFSGPSK